MFIVKVGDFLPLFFLMLFQPHTLFSCRTQHTFPVSCSYWVISLVLWSSSLIFSSVLSFCSAAHPLSLLFQLLYFCIMKEKSSQSFIKVTSLKTQIAYCTSTPKHRLSNLLSQLYFPVQNITLCSLKYFQLQWTFNIILVSGVSG
ncbi:hypothetical protein mRhiFer1_009162 [Rhinolophus ferrumequinum]|uniref:Uncharacterized protein n=1 Tax=Rhinolophus ferrumequinum TaxID=59479 RepID=A0A7J7SJJ6_RHIFE|nr:hypothetical protein mRhiFer1_009162 [Rhinolophus ferrumequinum]